MRNPIDVMMGKLRLIESYQAVFDNPDGKKVLAHLAKMAGVTKPTFVRNDPYGTAFNEGKRYMALCILNLVNKDQAALMSWIQDTIREESENEASV